MMESINIMWFAIIPLAFLIPLSGAEITFESKREEKILKGIYYSLHGIYLFLLCCIPFWILWNEGVI